MVIYYLYLSEIIQKRMVGATGFEPATSCAQGKRANHAAPRPAVLRIAQGFPCLQLLGLASPPPQAKPAKPPPHKKEATQRLEVTGSCCGGPSWRPLFDFEKTSLLCSRYAAVSVVTAMQEKGLIQTRRLCHQFLDVWFLDERASWRLRGHPSAEDERCPKGTGDCVRG